MWPESRAPDAGASREKSLASGSTAVLIATCHVSYGRATSLGVLHTAWSIQIRVMITVRVRVGARPGS